LKKNVIKLTLCIVITGIFLAGCSGTLQESVTPGSDQSNENIYSSNQEETNPRETKQKETVTNEKPQDKPIIISATDFEYSKKQFTIKKGQKVTILLQNNGKVFHDWVIKDIPVELKSDQYSGTSDHENTESHEHSEGKEHHDSTTSSGHDDGHNHGGEFSVHVSAATGNEGFVEFTATKTGEYEFYCSVPGHKEAGMIGILKVVE
jgi:uncharacterized cupredoxin-like copper-binding protein